MKYRSHHCNELNIKNTGEEVTLSGWVQKIRNLGGMSFIDLRDRYGITQLAFSHDKNKELSDQVIKLGREFVIKVKGIVVERSNKNNELATGEIEILVKQMEILNASKTPPFTIEDDTDGGETLRMKYRFMDLRRDVLKKKIMLRHKMLQEARSYLSSKGFLEIETPYLIKSTPEGARDFIVPSRLHQGEFYALPQSPQTFKQILMIAGFDKYFQIVRCFRDEDFRADRQPEFTQIDCEMSFNTQDDVLENFGGMIKHLFKSVLDMDIGEIPVMTWEEAQQDYGTDKPDLRYGMKFFYLNEILKGTDFNAFSKVLDEDGIIAGINVKGGESFSRKQLDELTDFVKHPDRGMGGMVYVKYSEDGTIKSTVDKFFTKEQKEQWLDAAGTERGDLLLILAGESRKTQSALGDLRVKIGRQTGLADPHKFAPLWVVDFPLMEWDENKGTYTFSHHPFTSPKPEQISKLDATPGEVKADCYDFVLNGHECASGSIRIHDKDLQKKVFNILNISEEEQEDKFGFLLRALEYGAPPHGGVAFGFDRLCALFSGVESIREVIAFPKNNAGKDTMLDAPSKVDAEVLKDLGIKI